jgi:hypothetical protein
VSLTLFAGGSEITFDRPQDEQAWQRNHTDLLSIRLGRGGNYLTAFLGLAAGFGTRKDVPHRRNA